MYCE
jgi:NAD+ synthase (glutamine-hydrolysing)